MPAAFLGFEMPSYRARDFAGKEFSLASGQAHYEQIAANGPDLLLLGAGPDWQNLPIAQKAMRENAKIHILQSPALYSASLFPVSPSDGGLMGHEIAIEDAPDIFKKATSWFYKPSARLDPEFWENLLGKMEALNAAGAARPQLVWLPGNDSQLVHRELREALEELGYSILQEDFSLEPRQFMRREHLPAVVISVNFHGLDSEGRIFNFCRAANIPVAVWLVDNPWNLLSGIRLPWWKKAHIFVTDKSFLPGLLNAGAQNAGFLPLAAARHFFVAPYDGTGAPIFVGRSEFPEKKRYFAAASLPESLLKTAVKEFAGGSLPDFHWWHERLGNDLWPGFSSRQIAFGAETFSQKNRQRWICAGAEAGLEIYGDEGWRTLAPNARLHPPIDYYGCLGRVYAKALAVLNATSLLLPQSLSQRHFDVWAANGLLLSDATRGLEIFPTELVEPVIVRDPAQLGERLKWFAQRPELRRDLVEAWRVEIRARHLYRHRVQAILEILQKNN